MGSQRVAQTEREYARNAQRPDRRADKASRSKAEDRSASTERTTQDAEQVFVPQHFKLRPARSFYEVAHSDGKQAGKRAEILLDYNSMQAYFSEADTQPLQTEIISATASRVIFEVSDKDFGGQYTVNLSQGPVSQRAAIRTR